MQFPSCDYRDSAKSLSSVAGKAKLYVGGALEERWGEREGRKKDGVRDIQEMKELPDRPVYGKSLLLLQWPPADKLQM